jgi:uncharacterized protein (DUF2249 family)
MHLLISLPFIQGERPMTKATQAIQIETRLMDSKNRRSLAFSTFEQRGVDAAMELVNENDPATLRSQFELEKPNLFTWGYLESGPEVWRVAVSKLKGKHGVDHCCGARDG